LQKDKVTSLWRIIKAKLDRDSIKKTITSGLNEGTNRINFIDFNFLPEINNQGVII
jgi:hypothetical protein